MPLIAQEIPKIGLVMEAVKVVRWLKNVGDTVNVGEALLEVETEKSVLEIEAVASGRLTQILVQADQQATVGDQVAWIDAAVAAPGTGRIVSTPVARKLAAEHGLFVGDRHETWALLERPPRGSARSAARARRRFPRLYRGADLVVGSVPSVLFLAHEAAETTGGLTLPCVTLPETRWFGRSEIVSK